MFDEDDTLLYMKSQLRKARKEHVCAECRRPITKGTRYSFTHFAYIEYGFVRPHFESAKHCLQCDADWEVLLQAELRSLFTVGVKEYGELRNRINAAWRDGILEKPQERELYFRWNGCVPGDVDPGERWRQMVLAL